MADWDRHYTLGGVLQVDEGYVGGHGDGQPRSGRSTDTQSLVSVMAEQRGSHVTGHIHIEVLLAADAESLHGMILEKVRPGARLLIDDWRGYRGIEPKGYTHDPVLSRGGRCAFKAWLFGTYRNFYQGRLVAYAAEYCWHPNRRNRTKAEYDRNLREVILPDRLLTLTCQHRHLRTAQVWVVR